MTWTIFADGPQPAALWAHDTLLLGGCPLTPPMIGFVFDWEVSEGGGALWNPTNCGPLSFAQCDAWHLPFRVASTTGSQYGGGAADYANRDDGMKATVNYWHMDNYTGLYTAMKAGNASAARAALIASPWAESHYHGAISTAPLPTGTIVAKVNHGKPPKGIDSPVWWATPTDGFRAGWRDVHKVPKTAKNVSAPDGTPMAYGPHGWAKT